MASAGAIIGIIIGVVILISIIMGVLYRFWPWFRQFTDKLFGRSSDRTT